MGARGKPKSLGTPKLEKGVCLSACSLAFLGGTFRYMHVGSTFGIHRFYSSKDDVGEDVAQIISGRLLSYIVKMGIDASLFELMTTAGPTEMLVLPPNELAKLRVVTGLKEEWTLKTNADLGIYLMGQVSNERGSHKMILFL